MGSSMHGGGRLCPVRHSSESVPQSGGIFLIDIVVASDVAGVTNLGFNAGYSGALSLILNANAGATYWTATLPPTRCSLRGLDWARWAT